MYISKRKLSYPISLPEDSSIISRALSIDFENDDDIMFFNSYVKSAIVFTERQIGKDIAYTENIATISDFSGSSVTIDEGNYNSIISITNDDTSTLITSYDIKEGYSKFNIAFENTLNCNSLTIKFTTGFDSSLNFDEGLKTAIIVKIADLYDKQRSSYGFSSENYNATWETMCDKYKLY